ncbi:hypothetical protein ACSW8S_15920 (plasmid) [Clostridium perfringens]
MKIFIYTRVYSWGDSLESLAVKANSKKEAMDKIIKFKENKGDLKIKIREEDLNEIDFSNNDVVEV